MKRAAALLIAVVATTAHAEQSPQDLAIESYKFLESYEAMLQGAINSGSKADFDRFIWQPAIVQLKKWPAMTNEIHAKYRACQWALDSFRVYSEDQFKAAGKLEKTHPQYRDYFKRKRECASVLKGKV